MHEVFNLICSPLSSLNLQTEKIGFKCLLQEHYIMKTFNLNLKHLTPLPNLLVGSIFLTGVVRKSDFDRYNTTILLKKTIKIKLYSCLVPLAQLLHLMKKAFFISTIIMKKLILFLQKIFC